ncbi:MAG: pyridoxine 5'-phosphate synthase [Nitrospinota bacterium]|nr:pyridoxine 5'-phosphate synthase [Nitrospinota bacterium]
MPKLCVNVDHVATIREARKTIEPDPVEAAIIAEKAGAIGITIHLREDRRHIQDRDLVNLKKVVVGKLNLEMAPVNEMFKFVTTVRPDQITLVPEKRQEITTEGGLDLVNFDLNTLTTNLNKLDTDILVSIFIDPSKSQIEIAKQIGVSHIELNTAAYSECDNEKSRSECLKDLTESANYALSVGLRVHAGHGLTYKNVKPICEIPGLEELNIGHSIVSKSVFTGFEIAVRDMVNLLHS